MTEYQEANLDIQRQRLELQRQLAEERSKAGGELTPSLKNSMLQGIRSVVLRIRQNPIMSRQVASMSDEELMNQEAELMFGVTVDDLRHSAPASTPPTTPNAPSVPTSTRPPRTAEEYMQLLRGE
jgi:hypothetical protein